MSEGEPGGAVVGATPLHPAATAADDDAGALPQPLASLSGASPFDAPANTGNALPGRPCPLQSQPSSLHLPLPLCLPLLCSAERNAHAY